MPASDFRRVPVYCLLRLDALGRVRRIAGYRHLHTPTLDHAQYPADLLQRAAEAIPGNEARQRTYRLMVPGLIFAHIRTGARRVPSTHQVDAISVSFRVGKIVTKVRPIEAA